MTCLNSECRATAWLLRSLNVLSCAREGVFLLTDTLFWAVLEREEGEDPAFGAPDPHLVGPAFASESCIYINYLRRGIKGDFNALPSVKRNFSKLRALYLEEMREREASVARQAELQGGGNLFYTDRGGRGGVRGGRGGKG